MMTKNKIVSRNDIAKIAEKWHHQNEKIVFTNGCFDILHLGHVDYLEKASQLGTKLILGVNTDASVKKLKGHERPINDELSRTRILAALSFVDAVVLFDEETPLTLIETIKPNFLVKGKDYVIENIVGTKFVLENNGQVETIDLIDGYSTTSIINKIKQLN